MTQHRHRTTFFELHTRTEVFVMPNPWDVGSAKMLAGAGFEALATTSAGFAWSQGRDDYGVTLDELVAHVRDLAGAVDVPLNVDSERCFADDPEGVADTVRMIHEAGAAGCSIEDYDPAIGGFDPISAAAERVAAAAEAAHRPDDAMVLTARCEHHLYGVDDLDDTIERLVAYRDAGADCVYAPGLTYLDQIRAVVAAVGVPVNVLARPGGPSVTEIGSTGARRVSVGGALASTAYGAAMVGARELLDTGTSDYLQVHLRGTDRAALG
jgi:2-methylisocitrate lyase-like PEP mutase family enzyme